MKMTKKSLSVLLACAMLLSLLSVGVVAAEGTQDNPINANDKWFGYGVDCFLLNTTLEAGDADGVWYELTADAAGILLVEHSTPSDEYVTPEEGEEAPEPVPALEYQVTVSVNGKEYLGYENGAYNAPIISYPVAVGDVISIHVIAQDTTLGGLVYCNAKIVSGDKDATIKVKSAPAKLHIAAGATVYFQDDTLQAEYATQYVNLSGDSVEGVTLFAAGANSAGVIVKQATFTDVDGDGVIEGQLGGSLGSVGAPPTKPAWIITNDSGEDRCFTIAVVEEAHECEDTDADGVCNVCDVELDDDMFNDGDLTWPCDEHEYEYDCSKVCAICEEETRPEAAHAYLSDSDAVCMYCGEKTRVVEYEVKTFGGNSIAESMDGVSGLAFRFNLTDKVQGLAVEEGTKYVADYTNATVTPDSTGTYKLVKMGAKASNGKETLDISVQEWILDGEGAPYYVIRIVNIPVSQYNTVISCTPYFVYENAEGEQITVYGDAYESCAADCMD